MYRSISTRSLTQCKMSFVFNPSKWRTLITFTSEHFTLFLSPSIIARRYFWVAYVIGGRKIPPSELSTVYTSRLLLYLTPMSYTIKSWLSYIEMRSSLKMINHKILRINRFFLSDQKVRKSKLLNIIFLNYFYFYDFLYHKNLIFLWK